jgi:putative transposase
VVSAFIDAHRDRFGVEPMCRVLCEHGMHIAPSTYYAAKTRPPSARSVADAELLVEIRRVCEERRRGRRLYGAQKVWRQLQRDEIAVGRCRVERLMRVNGLVGARRDKRFVTTRPDVSAPRPADLVKRNFNASKPNELWVVDFTYVPTWSGMAFTAFVSDVFSRRIVGWRTSSSMPTELPLDALEMALWARDRDGQPVRGVVHHSDAGTQLRFKGPSQHRLVGWSVGVRRGLRRGFASRGSCEVGR